MGLLTLPYMFVFEFLAPIIELHRFDRIYLSGLYRSSQLEYGVDDFT